MFRKYHFLVLPYIIAFLSLVSCGGSSNTEQITVNNPLPVSDVSISDIESEISLVIGQLDIDRPIMLMLESYSGRKFSFSKNGATGDTYFHSASASKWVMSAIALKFVDENLISLDTHPQTHIHFWPNSGPLSQITLEELLSMTSGLNNESVCINQIIANISNCVEQILANNLSMTASDKTFYYGSAHMQVAGLMIIKAGGFDNWEQAFNFFNATTATFDLSKFDRPSPANPRLAGGMTVSANEYMTFLQQLTNRSLLSNINYEKMFINQTNGSILGNSPAIESLNKNWPYGLGVWLECNIDTTPCTNVERFSSPGSFGMYPFAHHDNNMFGILAQQGPLGSFEEAYSIYNKLLPKIEKWAVLANN